MPGSAPSFADPYLVAQGTRMHANAKPYINLRQIHKHMNHKFNNTINSINALRYAASLTWRTQHGPGMQAPLLDMTFFLPILNSFSGL